jgi:hypothetical protein
MFAVEYLYNYSFVSDFGSGANTAIRATINNPRNGHCEHWPPLAEFLTQQFMFELI